MKLFYGVLAILCIHPVYSQTTPNQSDIIITQKPIKYFGREAELTCMLSKSTELPVVWTKVDINRFNEPVVISNGSTLLIDDSRFSFTDISYTNSALRIKNIERNDAGFYQCHISSGIDIRMSAEVELQVQIPPKIFDITNRFLVFAEGELVKLECYASGYPVPRISWRRENSAVFPTGGSLHRGNVLYIPSIAKEDRGTYYCIAENGVDPADRYSIGVEVEFAPTVTVPKTDYYQAIGYAVDLDCNIEAYPLSSAIWVKDGIDLYRNRNYKITNFITDHKTDTRLHIIDLQEVRLGNYICLATNKLGTALVTIHVKAATQKVCPPAC